MSEYPKIVYLDSENYVRVHSVEEEAKYSKPAKAKEEKKEAPAPWTK